MMIVHTMKKSKEEEKWSEKKNGRTKLIGENALNARSECGRAHGILGFVFCCLCGFCVGVFPCFLFFLFLWSISGFEYCVKRKGKGKSDRNELMIIWWKDSVFVARKTEKKNKRKGGKNSSTGRV